VRGDHGLKADLDGVTAAVADWIPRVVASARDRAGTPRGRSSVARRGGA
jgi:hypothetical protein